MAIFLTDRGSTVTAIVDYLKAMVPDFALVKPYEGELDRFSKKSQIQDDMFPAQVSLQTPFALVISKDRERTDKSQNNSLKFQHNISIYVGVASSFDFASTSTPDVFTLLTKSAQVLHGHQAIANAGTLTLVNDGEYLVRTDLFTVYDQKFFQLEIGF
ncbi:MAG: hypothetical protein CSYNP_01588 [Syntrophus sp. SKADARSKE-3]|nr:hypothetical protein [Syntrophus sp. SKADARSKE-3]